GHEKPVAVAGLGVALEQPLGTLADEAANEIGMALEPAIGEHDRARGKAMALAVLRRDDASAAPVLHDHVARPRAALQRSAQGVELRRQRPQPHIAGASLPMQPGLT